MQKLLIIVIAILGGFLAQAQPEGYSKVADTAYILQKVNEVASNTNTINTEFVQEKNLAFLYETITSNGILLYQKPDKLRLEYTSPFNYLLIMNSGELLIRNNNNEIKVELESSTMFNEINDLIINSIQGKILSMPELSTFFYENEESFFVQLWPQHEELKKYIKTIELFISKKDYTVTNFKVIELSDDYTLIKFVNKEINEEIPAGRFSFE